MVQIIQNLNSDNAMMLRFTLVFLVSCLCLSEARRPPNADVVEKYFERNSAGGSRFSDNLLEDASLDVPDLIRKYRYPSETHEVITEDGYILEVHRIPHGRDQNSDPNQDRPVVFAMHGLMASSADWVLMGPGTALGYALADAGFDVWMGNARGTFYSKRHVSLDPDRDLSYWRFSWDEIGRLDLPAMIDYALAATNKTRLHYIGHSQGTTAFWVMGSMRPEYNEKIITMQAYAPVAYLEYNANPVFNALAPFANLIESLAGSFGIGGILSRPLITNLLGRTFCSDRTPTTQAVCTNLLFLIAGYGPAQHNATMLPVKLAHTPAGAALRQIVHYGQSIGKNHFRRYDHGLMGNWNEYRSFTPPSYDLSKVTAPVYFHYVDEDVFADLRDMEKLWNQLGQPVERIKVPAEPFSHLDFSWGQHAKDVLYDRTAEIMKRYPNT